MKFSIFAVTYASVELDGDLYTETKIFTDEEKARSYMRDNVQDVVDSYGASESYLNNIGDHVKMEVNERTFDICLVEQPFTFYLNAE